MIQNYANAYIAFFPLKSTVVTKARIPASLKRIVKLTILLVKSMIHVGEITLASHIWTPVTRLERHGVYISMVVHIILKISFHGGFRTTIMTKLCTI